MEEFKKFSSIPRLSRECIVTEKLDGTNAQVLIQRIDPTMPEWITAGGDSVVRMIKVPDHDAVWTISAGSRKGYITLAGDNYDFAHYVQENAEELLALGEGRHYGEWWGKGIQRGYDQETRTFSLFNTGRWKDERVVDFEWNLDERTQVPECCSVVPVIGAAPFHSSLIEVTLEYLEQSGSVAAPGFKPAEGIVIYHSAADIFFKKTLFKDEMSKTEAAFRAKA